MSVYLPYPGLLQLLPHPPQVAEGVAVPVLAARDCVVVDQEPALTVRPSSGL